MFVRTTDLVQRLQIARRELSPTKRAVDGIFGKHRSLARGHFTIDPFQR
jgi:hypothetical protein